MRLGLIFQLLTREEVAKCTRGVRSVGEQGMNLSRTTPLPFRRFLEQVSRRNTNGRDCVNWRLEDGKHGTMLRWVYCCTTTVQRGWRGPSSNGSRPVPTRSTYRYHRPSRSIATCSWKFCSGYRKLGRGGVAWLQAGGLKGSKKFG